MYSYITESVRPVVVGDVPEFSLKSTRDVVCAGAVGYGGRTYYTFDGPVVRPRVCRFFFIFFFASIPSNKNNRRVLYENTVDRNRTARRRA